MEFIADSTGETIMDLFEKMQYKVGANLLSDIKFEPYRSELCKAITNSKFEDFSLQEFTELATYLFNEQIKFSSYEEVEKYFYEKSR